MKSGSARHAGVGRRKTARIRRRNGRRCQGRINRRRRGVGVDRTLADSPFGGCRLDGQAGARGRFLTTPDTITWSEAVGQLRERVDSDLTQSGCSSSAGLNRQNFDSSACASFLRRSDRSSAGALGQAIVVLRDWLAAPGGSDQVAVRLSTVVDADAHCLQRPLTPSRSRSGDPRRNSSVTVIDDRRCGLPPGPCSWGSSDRPGR